MTRKVTNKTTGGLEDSSVGGTTRKVHADRVIGHGGDSTKNIDLDSVDGSQKKPFDVFSDRAMRKTKSDPLAVNLAYSGHDLGKNKSLSTIYEGERETRSPKVINRNSVITGIEEE